MAAIFIALTLFFLAIFLMMGIASQARKARNSFLFFSLAAVSFLLLLTVLFFSAGLSTQTNSSFHSGKNGANAFIKFVPAIQYDSLNPQSLHEDTTETASRQNRELQPWNKGPKEKAITSMAFTA